MILHNRFVKNENIYFIFFFLFIYITEYERAFQKVAFGDKLSRDQLEEFFNEAGHYPTEGEISTAFNSVFKG